MRLRKNPTSRLCKARVGITLGDPSGIGPGITGKALNKLKGLAEFTVIGDKWVYEKIQNCRFIDLKNVNRKNFAFGKIRAEYGRASIEYLEKALELLKNKEIDCLVTCPISKEAINLAGFRYSGHTEYFARRTRTKEPVMMLLNKFLKFSLVTRHIPLKIVAQRLNSETIRNTILLTDKSLRKLFLIRNPRIVVCGLNPHASDRGIIGDEEERIIKPALQILRGKLKHIFGPEPADVAIAKAKQKEYDAVIALYHDQALIPLKLLDSSSGVNLTLGLPFIRTSPLHGTAFDIAGTNLANPSSLIAAIKIAIRCVRNLKRA